MVDKRASVLVAALLAFTGAASASVTFPSGHHVTHNTENISYGVHGITVDNATFAREYLELNGSRMDADPDKQNLDIHISGWDTVAPIELTYNVTATGGNIEISHRFLPAGITVEVDGSVAASSTDTEIEYGLSEWSTKDVRILSSSNGGGDGGVDTSGNDDDTESKGLMTDIIDLAGAAIILSVIAYGSSLVG